MVLTEPTGLRRSAAGKVLGIEIENNQLFPGPVGEAKDGAIILDRGELRCTLSYFKHSYLADAVNLQVRVYAGPCGPTRPV